MYNTAMVQEEQRCSNSSSGGGGGGSRSSKKAKQKKIPQRGLGVAKLEEMRLEEQQKKATSACIVLPLPQQHHQQASIPFPLPQHHHQQPSNPFPLPPLSTDLSPIFTSSMPVSGLDLYSPAPPTPPPFPHDVNAHLSFPPMWSSTDFSHDGLHEGRRMEPMFPFRPPPLLHNDPNSFWRSSMQRKQNQQHLPQPSSMVSQFPCFLYLHLFLYGWMVGILTGKHDVGQLQVNVLSSPPSSSGVNNLQMEPPSNQSYCSNSMPPWPEEERVCFGYLVRIKTSPFCSSFRDFFQLNITAC